MRRRSSLSRKTKETDVRVLVNLRGSGSSKVRTGVAFLDHMLDSLSTHGLFDISVKAKGDLQHHTVEDVAIALGAAMNRALGKRSGIRRFGFSIVPMDDALALAAVDLVRRPYFVAELGIERPMLEDAAREDLEHFFGSIATAMEATVHVKVLAGKNDHHKFEAATKAFALALREAVRPDVERRGRPPSSKGSM